METKEIQVNSIAELTQAAKDLLAFCESEKKMAFYGEMGAGKTTFIQALCQQLNSTDKASSPTYTLINEYHSDGKASIFHMDLYRLKNIAEALDIGIEDYLYNDNYCLIEWPQVIEPLLENHVKIKMEILEDSSRKILFL